MSKQEQQEQKQHEHKRTDVPNSNAIHLITPALPNFVGVAKLVCPVTANDRLFKRLCAALDGSVQIYQICIAAKGFDAAFYRFP